MFHEGPDIPELLVTKGPLDFENRNLQRAGAKILALNCRDISLLNRMKGRGKAIGIFFK